MCVSVQHMFTCGANIAWRFDALAKHTRSKNESRRERFDETDTRNIAIVFTQWRIGECLRQIVRVNNIQIVIHCVCVCMHKIVRVGHFSVWRSSLRTIKPNDRQWERPSECVLFNLPPFGRPSASRVQPDLASPSCYSRVPGRRSPLSVRTVSQRPGGCASRHRSASPARSRVAIGTATVAWTLLSAIRSTACCTFEIICTQKYNIVLVSQIKSESAPTLNIHTCLTHDHSTVTIVIMISSTITLCISNFWITEQNQHHQPSIHLTKFNTLINIDFHGNYRYIYIYLYSIERDRKHTLCTIVLRSTPCLRSPRTGAEQPKYDHRDTSVRLELARPTETKPNQTNAEWVDARAMWMGFRIGIAMPTDIKCGGVLLVQMMVPPCTNEVRNYIYIQAFVRLRNPNNYPCMHAHMTKPYHGRSYVVVYRTNIISTLVLVRASVHCSWLEWKSIKKCAKKIFKPAYVEHNQ